MWNLSSSISINKQLYTNTNTISDREIHVSIFKAVSFFQLCSPKPDLHFSSVSSMPHTYIQCPSPHP